MKIIMLLVSLALWLVYSIWKSTAETQLAMEYGLNLEGDCLSGHGLITRLRNDYDSQGNRTVIVCYSLILEDTPPGLVLFREGSQSGAASEQGIQELTIGDQDFDDLFWVQAADPEAVLAYLTPARRGHLMVAFQAMPEARLEASVLKGEQPTLELEVIPVLRSRVEHCLLLKRQLSQAGDGSPGPAPLESGWVNRGQRRFHAMIAALAASAALWACVSSYPRGPSAAVETWLTCLYAGFLCLGLAIGAVGLLVSGSWTARCLTLTLASVEGLLLLAAIVLFPLMVITLVIGPVEGWGPRSCVAALLTALMAWAAVCWWMDALRRVRVGHFWALGGHRQACTLKERREPPATPA